MLVAFFHIDLSAIVTAMQHLGHFFHIMSGAASGGI